MKFTLKSDYALNIIAIDKPPKYEVIFFFLNIGILLICIARLMLLKPPVLILDEATSSIDTMTEIRIQKAFQKLMEGRTSFVVAHRLSTIKESDVILVMKDGHILETGKHEELLEKKGFYAQLYQSQFCNV